MSAYRPGRRSPFRWLDPRRVPDGIRARVCRARDRRARRSVETLYRASAPQNRLSAGGPCVLADGMYDNPNHFFRLRLFLDALDAGEPLRRIGVVRTNRESGAIGTLESLGFDPVLRLEETRHDIESFRPEARRRLRGVGSHADLLRLEMPEEIPAYVFYDTVLKVLRHPHPPLDHEAWEYHLAELLRNMAIYGEMFDGNDIRAVVFSHGWKNEYAPAVWTAIRRDIPAYHLTGYYDSLRARLIASQADYACPKERLSFADFRALPVATRDALVEAGWSTLADRAAGTTTDINGRRAFRPESRPADRRAARAALGISCERRVGVIYAHAWYDFPHIFGLHNFTDYLDWMEVTLDAVSCNKDVLWFLKPHPLESWYGAFRLVDLARELPYHVRIMPEETDSLTATRVADLGVTVHGTIGFEAAAHGIPVIAADRSYYGDWPFVHEAQSREHYRTLLKQAAHLAPPADDVRRAAAAFAYLACAPHPDDAGLLRLPCDSLGAALYEDIAERLRSSPGVCERETAALADWLASGTNSYSVHAKLRYHASVLGRNSLEFQKLDYA